MKQEHVQYIKQALEKAANDIKGGDHVVQEIFDSARFLLRTINRIDDESVGVSMDGSDARYDFYSRVLQSAESFIQSRSGGALTEAEAGKLKQLRDDLEQLNARLRSGMPYLRQTTLNGFFRPSARAVSRCRFRR